VQGYLKGHEWSNEATAATKQRCRVMHLDHNLKFRLAKSSEDSRVARLIDPENLMRGDNDAASSFDESKVILIGSTHIIV
jgi:hypothetical protein